MSAAAKVKHYLAQHDVSAQALPHPPCDQLSLAIDHVCAVPELVVKSIVLIDRRGPVQVVLPYLAQIDVELINLTFNRQFQVLDDRMALRLFKDCVAGVLPPFGMAYGLPVIIDADMLSSSDHFFVPAGCGQAMLKIAGPCFRTLMKGAIQGRIARWPEQSTRVLGSGLNTCNGSVSLDSVSRKLEALYSLPPMPETATQILQLTSDPDSDVAQLAQLIERDPSLSAQLMRYARSPLFGYRGELKTVKDAVGRVLGFDRVAKLALSIAASKAFTISRFGPLGLEKFWQHALYNGVLSQALALMAAPALKLDDKEAYLAGLLHNFGMLLIGHLFPPEFKMLNKLRENEPEASMAEIEQQVFGMGCAQELISLGHGSIGAILLKLWKLPDTAIKVAAMHQNHHYTGTDEHYVWLIQLANHFLAGQGIGDEPSTLDPLPLLDKLGISYESALHLAEATLDQCRGLESMVCSMAS